MTYLDDHRMDSYDLKCGWIVVIAAGLAFLALALSLL